MSNNGPSTVEVEVMVNYGARLDGSFEIVILPLTVKDSQKRRVDIVVLHPWINRLNFVQPGYKDYIGIIVASSLLHATSPPTDFFAETLTAATKDAHDLKFTGEDFRDNFYRVTGDVLISDGRKARKRDSTGQPIDQVDIYGSVIMTKDGVPKEEDGMRVKLHVFAADALKKQSLKMPEEESIVIGRVSVIDKSSDRFQLSTVTDNVDDPELREVTILLRCPTSHGKTFLFHRMRPGDWVMVENMELYDAKWNSYVAQVEHVTRLPEWSYDVQHTISLMKNAEKDREAEELEELIERPTGSDEENEPPSQPSQAFGGDNYGWTQEIEKIPQGGSEIDKAIAQGGLTGPLLTQSKEGTVEVDDVFDFIEE
ncbi:hypothetical protein FOL47_010615 [Perkinsus chesapeaki]|uniref:Uncharacterized protein n=1 Tax=Perkinsus chesapeaki TaxID=330153 RepID=A0A7J6L277_PERCH|nr:hypothetical protein FOL47_010615 [Perkinsus chesapeaki]